MIGWVLLLASIYLALTSSAWWWIAVIPLVLWRLVQYQMYSSRPWRTKHHPLMRRYSAHAGYVAGKYPEMSLDERVTLALEMLVGETLKLPGDQASAFVAAQTTRVGQVADKQALITELFRRKTTASADVINEGVADIQKLLSGQEPAVRVRVVVAGLIERQLSSSDRAEYLFEVASGNAN